MALKDVNLLDEDMLFRRRIGRYGSLWGVLTLVSLGIIAATAFAARQSLATRRPKTDAGQEVKRELARAASEIQQIQTELEQLSYLRRARARCIHTAALGELSAILNPRVWLENCVIEADDGDGPCRATLNGLSFTNADLGDLLNGLGKHAMFGQVALKSSQEMVPGEDYPYAAVPEKMIRFRIECTVSRN